MNILNLVKDYAFENPFNVIFLYRHREEKIGVGIIKGVTVIVFNLNIYFPFGE